MSEVGDRDPSHPESSPRERDSREPELTAEEIRQIRNKAMSPPKPLLLAASAMVILTIALAAAWRYWLDPGDTDSGIRMIQTQAFRFVPLEDEGLDVRLMPEDTSLTVVHGNLSNFLQGIVRSLGRQRLVAQVDDMDAPFQLTYWADGRLTLEDPTTETTIALQAYGADNTAHVFALLRMAEPDALGGAATVPTDSVPSATSAPPATEDTDGTAETR